MTARAQDIAALLDHARDELPRIEEGYQESLRAQQISPQLRIEVKNLFGDLRAALDYLAKDIHERNCGAIPKGKRFYFPILPDRATFERRMEEWFPGLRDVAPALWEYLESVQPYHDAYAWLGQFNTVNNENKHDHLIEQTRLETPEVRVDLAGGGAVTWNPNAVRFGPGIFIGGVPVDPRTQRPQPHPSQKVTRTIWVDFQFEGVTVSALGLMQAAVQGVRAIVRDVQAQLN